MKEQGRGIETALEHELEGNRLELEMAMEILTLTLIEGIRLELEMEILTLTLIEGKRLELEMEMERLKKKKEHEERERL